MYLTKGFTYGFVLIGVSVDTLMSEVQLDYWF